MNCLPNQLYIRIAGRHDDPFMYNVVPESVYDFVSANWNLSGIA